jgi:outer membrane protein assembly factor BamB
VKRSVRVLVVSLAVLLACAASALAAPASWSQLGRTNAGTEYNRFETAITAATVHRLAPAWRLSAQKDDHLLQPIATPTRVYVPGQTIYALDPRTGGVIWKRPSKTAVSPTLTLANGVLYEVGRAGPQGSRGPTRGVLYARSAATGKVLWSVHSALGLNSTFTHGFQGSATVADGIVYFGEINITASVTYDFLNAYSVTTHKRLWRQQFGGLGYKPVVSAGIVYGLGRNASNGWNIYSWTAKTGIEVNLPIGVASGATYAVGPSRMFIGEYGNVLAVPSGKCKNGDCKVLWSHPFSPSFFGTVALTPDRVFAVSFTTAIDPVQVVQALAPGTGRVIWQGSAASVGFPAHVSVAGNVAYVAGLSGIEAFPVKCATPCQPLWHQTIAPGGPATVVNGRVIVTSVGGNRVFDYSLK